MEIWRAPSSFSSAACVWPAIPAACPSVASSETNRPIARCKAALHLAIGLFVSEEATLGQAAEIAGQTQAAFQKELGARHISMHYGMDELAEDLKTVESFRR